MKVGIICGGIGARSTGDFIRRSARCAERLGFSSYWLPEHVLLFGAYPQSVHPYAYMRGKEDEAPAFDPNVPWADPIVGMTWAAAATSTIEIGSSIIILPQRNPVVLAKEVVTLDEFSGGRVAIGAGVGWCKEEYETVGADWEHRGRRMDEHIRVLRSLWNAGMSEFEGETVRISNAYMYPKPVRGGIPILVGGESEAALNRVAMLGDGWNAIKLPVERAAERIVRLKELTRRHGRDPDDLRLIATVFPSTPADILARYRDAGVTEFNLMTGEIPVEDAALDAKLEELSTRFVEHVADW